MNTWFRCLLIIAGGIHLTSPDAGGQERRVLRVVYFSPTDRTPEPDRVARLDRVMKEVQQFFRDGMKQNGYGPMSFELERDSRGELRIHEVRATGPMNQYGREAASRVREEVNAALRLQGIDISRETIIIFQQLLEWRGDRAIEIGPYVGGGNAHSGTAWVYDDAKLDPNLLNSTKPGGYYNGPCSLGQFNTHYIGGVAHELGHALGLPHERERPQDSPRRGASLMGSGNHQYGRDRRGQGPGAFLTAASALPLAVHPLFTGKSLGAVRITNQVRDLSATSEPGVLHLSGTLRGEQRLVGVVAYNDPLNVPGDYDALGWTCPVDAEGRFRLRIEDLQPGEYELRLRIVGATGDDRYVRYRYRVGVDRVASVQTLLESEHLAQAMRAFSSRDDRRLVQLIEDSAQAGAERAVFVQKLEHLRRLMKPESLIDVTTIPKTTRTVRLADLKLDSTVGWGTAQRNRVPAEGDAGILLEVGGQFHASGLYAHARSRHAVRLDGSWTRLTTAYGLQDGHGGSVVFMVRGDGRERWRSELIRDHKVRRQTINVTGVKLLELIVEDGGDNTFSDWGVWLTPELHRP